MERAQALYWHQQFIVRATAEFPRYLMGHPKMPVYREWAEGIIRELAAAFDEEEIWRRTKENYVLRQHMPATNRNLTIPVGPILTAPATPPGAEPTAKKPGG